MQPLEMSPAARAGGEPLGRRRRRPFGYQQSTSTPRALTESRGFESLLITLVTPSTTDFIPIPHQVQKSHFSGLPQGWTRSRPPAPLPTEGVPSSSCPQRASELHFDLNEPLARSQRRQRDAAAASQRGGIASAPAAVPAPGSHLAGGGGSCATRPPPWGALLGRGKEKTSGCHQHSRGRGSSAL